MCTLAIFRDVSSRYPLVVAANRDEFYSRATAPPSRFEELPGAVGGRDLEAGGTWLGCRSEGHFMVAGLLNRRSLKAGSGVARGECSRGRLCLEALRAAGVDQAEGRVGRSAVGDYGGFNLLLADLERAVVVDNRQGIHSTELGAGLSVLTNLDVNDPRCPRLASATVGFNAAAALLATDPDPRELVAALSAVLANHNNSADPTNADPLARVCVHTDGYGTRSSSIIFFDAHAGRPAYYHADGPPCRRSFDAVLS